MNLDAVKKEISAITSGALPLSKKEICAQLLGYIDLTTLDGTDTKKRVTDLCAKAKQYQTAAVCVYPYYAPLVSGLLKGSGIRTACVAGGFPASQTPLEVKLMEVKYVLDNGADDVDMVLSQGAFLEGDMQRAGKEIRAIKDLCGAKAHLKVILETGALQEMDLIEEASVLAIDNGADFIKTSTGKTTVSATLEAFYVMLQVIKKHYDKTGKRIGIKPAGGISTVDGIIPYFQLLHTILGKEWMNKDLFRIGASRLADGLAEEAGIKV